MVKTFNGKDLLIDLPEGIRVRKEKGQMENRGSYTEEEYKWELKNIKKRGCLYKLLHFI